MDSARRMLQAVRIAFIAVIVTYFFIVNGVPSHTPPNPTMLVVLVALACVDIVALLILRQILVIRPEQQLLLNAADVKALATWKAGHIVMYAMALSVAIYGLLLHFLGFPIRQVIPFFAVAILLLALLPPRSLESRPRP